MDIFTDPNYEMLGRAVVVKAAEDYKNCKFLLDTVEERTYKHEEDKLRALEYAKNQIYDVELFFGSEWFSMLSGLNGERAFKALKDTYKHEYYPARYKEFKAGHRGWHR